MPQFLNAQFDRLGIELSSVRLLRHQDRRAAKDRSPYELWRDDRPAFESYQSVQSPRSRTRLTTTEPAYWASFVVPPTQETIFAGLYRAQYRGPSEVDIRCPVRDAVDLAGTLDVYNVEPDERMEDLNGRLVVAWGAGFRAWIQRADSQDKEIIEVSLPRV